MCTVDLNYVSVYFITLRAVVAQEGPGVVIVQPAGQDVELLCTVTELNDTERAVWLVNHTGPYGHNALLNGQLPGHTSNNNNNNLIVKNITMNDARNNTEYQCAITHGTMPTERRSGLTILYVSGEFQYM